MNQIINVGISVGNSYFAIAYARDETDVEVISNHWGKFKLFFINPHY